MKNKEIFYAEGKKRAGQTHAPITRAEVTEVTKDSYFVLWAGSHAPIEIKKERFEEKGKHKNKDGEFKLHKIRKET